MAIIMARSINVVLATAMIMMLGVCKATMLIGSSQSRLPMSLSSVINDLEAEGVTHVTTACFLTSRGITKSQKSMLLEQLFGIESEQEKAGTAFGTTQEEDDVDGLAIASPPRDAPATEVASSVVACGGTVVYVPSPTDLARAEGLFDTLAPAMERLLAKTSSSSTPDDDGDKKKPALIVVLLNEGDEALAKRQLEQAASVVLTSLVQPSTLSHRATTLQDVFQVQYITPSQYASLEDVLCGLESHCEPADAAALVASTVDILAMDILAMGGVVSSGGGGGTTSLSLSGSPKDLAAARQWGPKAREALETAVGAIRQVIAQQPGGFTTNYGDLCRVMVQRALQDLEGSEDTDDEDSKSSSKNSNGNGIKSATVAKQIRANLQDELYAELGDILEEQLPLLQQASFEEFRRNLSQLKVSPLLAQDMDKVIQTAVTAFTKTLSQMTIPGKRSLSHAKTAFVKTLQEYSSDRLLAAKASGAFRPIPRKGVTVGLHWLLPKPFGNDFRQEPWMVHATDHLVYVPQDKITNVGPDDVKVGDWRRKIVPSPAARDMVYLQ